MIIVLNDKYLSYSKKLLQNINVLLFTIGALICFGTDCFSQISEASNAQVFNVKMDADNYFESVGRILMFQPIKGELILNDHSFSFKTLKKKNAEKDFQYEWSEVQRVYKSGKFVFRNNFFFPNMITIEVNGDDKTEIWFITTKRKIIIDAIEAHIQ